jgi:hypothetical protein
MHVSKVKRVAHMRLTITHKHHMNTKTKSTQPSFPEVALHFVQDPQTRFRLALACGNIEVK